VQEPFGRQGIVVEILDRQLLHHHQHPHAVVDTSYVEDLVNLPAELSMDLFSHLLDNLVQAVDLTFLDHQKNVRATQNVADPFPLPLQHLLVVVDTNYVEDLVNLPAEPLVVNT
jgi:hypothetical protein